MKANRIFGLVFAGVVLSGVVGACSDQASDGDGESHFLVECSAAKRCASGLDCVCGACTKPCTADSQCTALASESKCVLASTCSTRACGITCETNADCANYGTTTCVGGVCSVASAGNVPDGSVPDLPDTGPPNPLPDTGVTGPVLLPDTGPPDPGPTDSPDGQVTDPGDAGDCCIADKIEWTGGASGVDTHSVGECTVYRRVGPVKSCSALVPYCGATGITTRDVLLAVGAPEVAAAFAADATYGTNDASKTTIRRGGHTVVVGADCAGAPACTDPPEAVARLVQLLDRVVLQELGSGSCAPQMRCYADVDPGPCTGPTLTRYYYDAPSQTCKSFEYSGCGGGINRFDTQSECEKTCPRAFDACSMAYGVPGDDAGAEASYCSDGPGGMPRLCFHDPRAACACTCARLGLDSANCDCSGTEISCGP